MVSQKSLILKNKKVRQKLRRIAYEIHENNFDEKGLIIAGIHEKGYHLSKILYKELKSISSLDVKLVKILIDKEKPMKSEVQLDCDLDDCKGKTIIMVDDVLNTGKTFAYGMKPFLNIEVKKIEVVVLVNRSHTKFPVSSTYTGYELSTTLNDHIEVKFEDEDISVYLH